MAQRDAEIGDEPMAFTDHCDIYLAVLEAGANRVIQHIMQQRPSLFNYGILA